LEVGKRILEYREQKTIMLTELAEATGISKNRLKEIEEGGPPSLQEFRLILKELHVSPLQFFRTV
jgi:transcriptional regulator with XRE-family HTH domain